MTSIESSEARRELLIRAYELILSWPEPDDDRRQQGTKQAQNGQSCCPVCQQPARFDRGVWRCACGSKGEGES